MSIIKNTRINRPFVFLFLSFFSWASLIYAQAPRRHKEIPRFELKEVVITASRTKDTLMNIPRNVTVITSEEIEQAPSNNIVDLLAREPGVHLRSLFGQEKWAGVDIRGMGDTRGSNIIIMVDGVRLNPPDMAGPDFSFIALDQIQRIEILHGTGGVMYGDGAVGGVINIITKKGFRGPKLRIFSSYGSYATKDFRASFMGKIKDFILNAHVGDYNSSGYRDNGKLDKTDASLHLGYALSEPIRLSFITAIHKDKYGLPGPVDRDAWIRKDIRRTNWPLDSGETTDRRHSGVVEIDLGAFGQIRAQRGYRIRENSYVIGLDPNIAQGFKGIDQTNRIDEDTRDLSIHYTTVYKIRGLEHRLQMGMDHYKTAYTRENYAQNKRNNSHLKNWGVFLAYEWPLIKQLVLRMGYRQNRYRGRYRTDAYQKLGQQRWWANGHISYRRWANEAYDTGVVFSPSPYISFFTSLATSFRVPNVDELAQADEDLHPQKGAHFEIGMRSRMKGFMEFSAAYFHTRIRDEIYYHSSEDPLNKNYTDKTLRRGVETDFKLYPADFLYLWGNYAFTEARFEKRGSFIPLVPKHKATIGLEYQVLDNFMFTMTGTLVGSSFNGNDSESRMFEKQGGYEVFDVQMSYEYKALKLFLGVNNLLGEYYSTLVYGQDYYPMPLRNFYGGMKWRF